ncbi:unnamed protein product [Miscanthus lutarioriparius]|uniref:VQ domain-containing protein n=1 Tax=Miscanthus lutarioriparius TaxID=422564 RepID=A0A811S8I7_9POAL|nr:unnamed protein product [Miscanthus lutarioriparius]
MEGQPRSGGGGASWGPPPPVAPAEATRRAAGGPRLTTTHQRQQVKVKHIVTREVSTDVANFKDVVQRLTGKDSAAARAAVVAAGSDGTSCWSGGTKVVAAGRGATTTIGVASGAVMFEDNVAGATPMFLSEEDTRGDGGGVRD